MNVSNQSPLCTTLYYGKLYVHQNELCPHPCPSAVWVIVMSLWPMTILDPWSIVIKQNCYVNTGPKHYYNLKVLVFKNIFNVNINKNPNGYRSSLFTFKYTNLMLIQCWIRLCHLGENEFCRIISTQGKMAFPPVPICNKDKCTWSII